MLLALLLIAAAAVACVLVIGGWGAWVRRAFGVEAGALDEHLDDFWVGLALTIALLQVWHLWQPVDGACAWIVGTVGGLGVLWSARSLCVGSLAGAVPLWRRLGAAAAVGGLALAVAWGALGPLSHYDTQLYHYPAVEWVSAYPIVPGLANLHGRFGFNSAYPLVAALLDRGLFEARAHHLVQVVLLLAALLQSVLVVQRGLRDRAGASLLTLYAACVVGPLLSQWPSLLSLSNDVPTFILGMAVMRLLLRLLSTPAAPSRLSGYLWFALVVVASAGVVLKSNFGFLALPVVISGGMWLLLVPDGVRWPSLARCVGLAALAGGVLLVPWVVRGYALSGYPLYPLTIGALEVAWRVPRSLVLSEAYAIRGHARLPEAFWTQVLSGWQWIAPWWERARRFLLVPFLLGGAGLGAVALRLFLRRDGVRARVALHLLLPPLLALVAWFVTAPAPRFAGAALWILPALACALLFGSLDDSSPRLSWRLWALCALFCLASVPLDVVIAHGRLAGLESFEPMRVAETRLRSTDSGDQVFVPDRGFFCTRAPLPCTPYFRRNLRYLTPANPGGGFALDPTFTLADFRQRTAYSASLSASADLGVCVVARGGCYGVRRTDRVDALQAPIELLVYSESPASVELLITPRRSSVPAGAERRLRVVVGGRDVAALPVSSAETVLRTLVDLQQGFTVITLIVSPSTDPAEGRYPVPLELVSFRNLSQQ